jgi:predicted transcriptional regulator
MEIEKGIEDEILKELSNSETLWTNLYPFMKNSEYNFNDFYKVLKELIEEGVIKAENNNSFVDLQFTKKGKLVGCNELTFKLNKKGYLEIENAKLQNEKLEYELTIRNLEEELKISSLLKNYWGLILSAIGVGIAIGKLLV